MPTTETTVMGDDLTRSITDNSVNVVSSLNTNKSNPINEALALQLRYEQKGRKVPRIGELLVSLGYMTPKQVEAVLRSQGSPGKNLFGEIANTWKILKKKNEQTMECPNCGEEHIAPNFEAVAKCLRCQHVFIPTQLRVDKTSAAQSYLAEVGPYQLLKLLGSSQSDVLYKARHIQTGIEVCLRALFQQSPDELDMWVKAWQMASELSHPNIQRIQSMGWHEGYAFIVMEYVEGWSLRQRLKEVKRLAVHESLDIMIQAGEALAHGHSHDIIHGHLRPSHILISHSGRVRLGGLGAPRQVMRDVRLLAEQGSEIPLYLAPEILIDEDYADERSDIYGLAAIGYHMIVGQPPKRMEFANAILKFDRQKVLAPRSLDPSIVPFLDRLLLKGLAIEPDDRFPSVTAFLADLRKCRDGLLIHAPFLTDSRLEIHSSAPLARKRFSQTHVGRRLHAYWVKTGKAKAIRKTSRYHKNLPPVTSANRSGTGAQLTQIGLQTTRTMPIAQVATETPPSSTPNDRTRHEEDMSAVHLDDQYGKVRCGALEPAAPNTTNTTHPYPVQKAHNGSRKRGRPESQKVSAIAVISAILSASVVILAMFFLSTRENPVPQRMARDSVAINQVEREALVDVVKDDYEALAAMVNTTDDQKTIIREIDKFLHNHRKVEPVPEQVLEVRQLRKKHLIQGVALSHPIIKNDLEDLISLDRYAQAVALVQAWRAEWGIAADEFAAEEVKLIKDTETENAETEFLKLAALTEAKDWDQAARLCDVIASRFNATIAARARSEKTKIQKAESDAKVAAQQAQAAAERDKEEAERVSRAQQVLATLTKDLRDPLAILDLEAAKGMLDAASVPLTGTGNGPDYQTLKVDVALLDAMRGRMVSSAQQGQLRDMRIAYQQGHFGIVDGTREGPVLDIDGGRVMVRWSELSQDERIDIAKRSMDASNGKHQHELGYYLCQIGQPFMAEKALKAAHRLGAPVDTLLARVRGMQKKVVAQREKEESPFAGGTWENPRYVTRPLTKQDAVTEDSLKGLGWEISKGYWTITSDRTIFGEWQDPQLPLISMKRELKRFSTLSYEIRAHGHAVGFSFGTGMRFLVKPDGRWQKLEITVTAGDLLKFLVDGVATTSLEETGAVRSEQLPDSVYVRCEGRLCEIRDFTIDGKAVGTADLPWATVKKAHQADTQHEKGTELLKAWGWSMTEGTWTVTPSDTYLGLSKDGAANLQREKPAFRKLSIEFRGEGDAAGFSFGKGMRYLARPTDKWQKLTVEVVVGDLLRMLIDDKARASIEDAKGVTVNDLPKVVYLRVEGGAAEFRTFSVDGVPVIAPSRAAKVNVPQIDQDPEEADRIKGKGWEIAGGVWKLDADDVFSGVREQANNLMSIHSKLLRFQELGVEVRGKGDSAGFSFGQGMRWLVPLSNEWQQLQLQVLENGQLQLLVNGEGRNSLDDTKGVVSDRLGEVLYLRAQGRNVQFRNFKVEQAGGEGGAQAPAPKPQPVAKTKTGAGAETAEALKKMDWEVSRGQWTVDGEIIKGTIRQGDEVSIKRSWKRGTSISVDVKGDGYAVGFGWDGDKNIILRPADQWQTVKVETGGAHPVLYVNGVQRSPLEDIKHIKCDQLGGTLYLRSYGGKVEFRKFEVQ